jgi:hypothetical protein
MPGNSTNVGPGPSPPVARQTVQFVPGDEPALASIDHMDTSAPIEPTTPDLPVGEVPHESRNAPKPAYPLVPPLSDEVSPFKIPEPKIPATEYVPVSVIEAVAPKSVMPEVKPAVPPKPPEVSGVPKAATFQASQANQAIGPIIQKHPSVSPPTPKPVVVVSSATIPNPAPIKPAEPPRAVTPPRPIVPAPTTPPQPIPEPTQPVSVPRPVTPLESISSPAVPEAIVTTAVPAPAAAAPGKPVMIFSHNTQAVWHVRRSSRVLNIVLLLGVCVIVGGMVVYWLSIGSPTRVEDLPFVSSQK